MIHAAILTPTIHKTVKSCTYGRADSCKDHDERTVHINLSSTARPVPVGRFLKSGPSLKPVIAGIANRPSWGAGKELRVQKRGKGLDCINRNRDRTGTGPATPNPRGIP